ncbi:DUF6427 family protein [Christiangramia forsetii]|uniref:Membrane protein n=2 Tax=Christiangramia forsetii TaxID=411153 RepID=A0M6H8_CHRFK|nr:DUF6427 family protein [Christiangramia forsetii]GGG30384.1 hypothetical protein GCM10011532_12340 [Christiangramia forsetii]CAL68223.1 membrane protein [Christiangramia forsetii KT0803]
MLTSFFNKSKPINLSVVIVLLCIFYIGANFSAWINGFNWLEFFEKLGVLLLLVLSLLVLNFIAKKNELTKRSAYKTLLFAIFCISFGSLLKNESVIISNLCVLFAMRRIISLRSHKFVEKKIFDATFWISIATLYHFWSALFFLIVFFAILNFAANFKNWLIPFVAFLAVVSLTICFHLIAYDEFYTFSNWFQASNFDFTRYGDLKLLIPLSIILGLLIWTLFQYFSSIQKASITRRPVLTLIIFSLLVAAAVSLFSPTKNGSELIFFFVPLSIISSNYFDNKKDKILKEIILITLIIMPFVVAFFV